MPELVQIIVSTITQHFERQLERNQKRKDEDYDEGVEDQVLKHFSLRLEKFKTWHSFVHSTTGRYVYFFFQLVDEDEEDVYTLSKLGDLFHALFSTHKEKFLPVFDQLLIHVNKLLVSDCCVTIDMIGVEPIFELNYRLSY